MLLRMTTMTFDNKCFEKLHKTEAWMYTNVSALAKIDFALSTTFVDEQIIHGFDVTPANSFIVLINGVFNEEASRLSDGIEINAAYELAGTIASRGDSFIPSFECDTVTITNNQEKTIHILQLVTGDCATAASGSVFIHAKEGESISVAETHVCLGDSGHLFMPLTEIMADKCNFSPCDSWFKHRVPIRTTACLPARLQRSANPHDYACEQGISKRSFCLLGRRTH